MRHTRVFFIPPAFWPFLKSEDGIYGIFFLLKLTYTKQKNVSLCNDQCKAAELVVQVSLHESQQGRKYPCNILITK